MRLEPLLAWWLTTLIALIGFTAIGYLLWKIRHQGKQEILRWSRRACMLLFLVIICLGPSIPGGKAPPGISNLDVIFVVDTTASMGAEDYAGNKLRIDGVKQDLLDVGNKLQGAHLAIVTFDSKVNTVLPFTTDNATFVASVQSIHQETQGTSKGSAIDRPIKLVTQELKTRKGFNPEHSRLLFYLGDGEQTNDKTAESFKPLAELLDGGAVLGYGTSDGAKMLKYTSLPGSNSAPPTYVNALDTNTKTFVPAISKKDEKALKKIAEELGVSFSDRNNGGSIDEIYQSSKAQLLTDEGRGIIYYLNLYWLFAIPFTILLFWEWKGVIKLAFELRRQEVGKKS